MTLSAFKLFKLFKFHCGPFCSYPPNWRPKRCRKMAAAGTADGGIEPLIRANLHGLRKLYASLTLRSLSMSTSVCERDFLALMHELTAVRAARLGGLRIKG